MGNKYEKLIEILQDEVKASEVFSDTIEETQKNLESKGLDFSIDELSYLADNTVNEECELSENMLD